MIPTLQLGQVGRTGVAADPFFSSVSLLLHGEGSDGGTTITDSSSFAKTCTAVNEATTRTAQFKFGSASMLIATATNNSMISVPNDSTLDVASSDFTIEMWARFTTVPSVINILCLKATGTGVYPFRLIRSAFGNLQFQNFNSASSLVNDITGTTILAANTWYFLQARRKLGDTFAIAVNGVQENFNNTSSHTLFSSSAVLSIGNFSSAATFPMIGNIDEFRFTKGVARAFALPTHPFYNP